MYVEHDKWYVKWFLWNCKVLDRFTENSFYNSGTKKYANGANLCQFFRIIFFGSILSLFSILMWVYLAFVIFVLPFILFPIVGILMFLAYIAMFIAILSILFFIIFSMYSISLKMEKIPNYFHKILGSESSSFIKVIYTYVKGIKEKICPIITFSKKDITGA